MVDKNKEIKVIQEFLVKKIILIRIYFFKRGRCEREKI